MAYTTIEAIRAAAAATTSYVASSAFDLAPVHKEFVLEITITKGDATSFEWYLEGKSDDTNWFRLTSASVSLGTASHKLLVNTVAGADLGTTERIFDVYERYAFSQYRVQFKRTGGTGTDSVKIQVRKAVN